MIHGCCLITKMTSLKILLISGILLHSAFVNNARFVSKAPHKKDFMAWDDAENNKDNDLSSKWMKWDASIDNAKVVKPANEKKLLVQDPCEGVFCHLGRVCISTIDGRGECVCADSEYCAGHAKPVCGSNGAVYPSHCELHRVACVQGMRISVDHTGKSCARTVDDIHSQVEHMVRDEYPRGQHKIRKQHGEDIVWERLEPEPLLSDTSTTTPSPSTSAPTASYEEDPIFTTYCTEIEYEQFKANLMRFHCARIGETHCDPDIANKPFVGTIMFSYYDADYDKRLSETELEDVQHRDHLEKISHECRLVDMLTFDDKAEDGYIDLNDFYRAFHISTVALDKELEVFTTQVLAGNSIELKCEIEGATELIWKRNGALVHIDTAKEVQLFEDHSLYIDQVDLQHTGNYTCEDRYHPHVIQTHVLLVQQPPIVRVNPPTQFHTSGATVQVRCHAEGVPDPEIFWEINEEPLLDDPDHRHYAYLNNNSTLEIHQAVYTKDTGAYKCKARNAAGTGQDVGTVFIENSEVPIYGAPTSNEEFVVFHDKGYTIYEPAHCHIEHQVASAFSVKDMLPDYGDSLPTLCNTQQPCQWGGAVNVKDKFIFATQPSLNRVVVIETFMRMNPVEIIPTDSMPVAIHYVEHLDQVWVLCWNEHEDEGSKTTVVIREASKKTKHHTVHTQPIANRFDLVKDLFLPPKNSLQHKFNHGYTIHKNQQILYKLDLEAIKYSHTVDLSSEDCLPISLAFIPMGGQVIVHCQSQLNPQKTFQLILDYVTDAVLSKNDKSGYPFVSPDGRYLVLVDEFGNDLMVYYIKDDGQLDHLYDQSANVHISDVSFFPAEHGKSFDLYASSRNQNDVLYMNLASSKVELIEGVGESIKAKEWPWSKQNRVMVSSGVFGQFLMTPSQNSVVVIDGRRRHVQCEWQNIGHGNVIVWVEPKEP